uniref:Uncharacterized protein n=1 Tax=Arundo donax TaxID=35708 RepID=A0A0A8YW95_ARUDO
MVLKGKVFESYQQQKYLC